MLSVVITAWNEELNLPRAVSSLKDLADEIVVVDTESTDGTAAVAKKLGCKVFKHKNTGVVEPVRNFSISKTNGDWILLLDADEEIPATLALKIKEILQQPKADYYRLARKSIIFGQWIKNAHWWPDYVYRLFKKGSVSWDDTIHSIPFTKGVGKDLPATEDLAILHHHYSTISQYIDRINRYSDYQSQAILAKGHDFAWTDLVNKPFSEFINLYFANKGYQDGLHGLVLAGLQAFSEFVLYSKLWQQSGFVTQAIQPKNLAQELTVKTSEYQWWLKQADIDQSNFWQKPLLKLKRKIQL
jgi:glycosyltransferase involved in cell wall biosynthesis